MVWQDAANLAPIATATIALFAACTAVRAVNSQRDTARRRAAIDFFLKTETEEKLIIAYNEFKDLIPQIPAIAERPTLSNSDGDIGPCGSG